MRSLKSPPNLHLYAARVLEKLSSAEAKQVSRHGAKINLLLCASLNRKNTHTVPPCARGIILLLLIALLCMSASKRGLFASTPANAHKCYFCLHTGLSSRVRCGFCWSGCAMRGIHWSFASVKCAFVHDDFSIFTPDFNHGIFEEDSGLVFIYTCVNIYLYIVAMLCYRNKYTKIRYESIFFEPWSRGF